MNNIDKVIQALQGKNPEDKNRWVDLKEGWWNFKYPDGLDIYQKIQDAIGSQVNCKDPDYRPALNFTLIKKKNGEISAYRTEEALERAIVVSNDSIYNQFNLVVGSKKENIDIVLCKNDKPYQLIELKPWKSKNPPTYAFVEIIKNFILFKDKNSVEKLTLLAPSQYYISYYKKSKESSVEQFFELINKYNNGNHPKFTLMHIKLSKDEFNRVIKNLEKDNAWKKSRTTRYEEYQKVEVKKEHIQKIVNPSLLEKLLLENWEKIENPERWPKVEEGE